MTTEHTPTPWKADPDPKSILRILDAEGREVTWIERSGTTMQQDREVRDRIIQRVNAYEPMREALNEAELQIDDAIHHDYDLEHKDRLKEALYKLRAALALTEEP